MLAIYLGFLGFGVTVVGLLLAMGGGKEGDADHGDADHGDADHGDADHGDAEHGGAGHPDGVDDADHGDFHHGPAAGAGKGDVLRLGPGKLLLSVRFWTFFAAAFGATGTLATLVGIGAVVTFLAALVTGLAVGVGAHALFRAIQQDRVSGETDLSKLAGEEATVLVAVRPGARGQVRIQRPSGTRDLMATSRDGTALEVGSTVLVTAVEDGVADVTGTRPAAKRTAAEPPQRLPEGP
jgi:hypothetical protein